MGSTLTAQSGQTIGQRKKIIQKILSTVVLKYIELGKIGQQIYDLFADLIHINRVDIERSLPEDKKQPKSLISTHFVNLFN